MSAKRKKSDKNLPADPLLEPNKDTELEKKVDAMLSLDEDEALAEAESPNPSDVTDAVDPPKEVAEPSPKLEKSAKKPKNSKKVIKPDPEFLDTLVPASAEPAEETGNVNEPVPPDTPPLLPTEELPDLETVKKIKVKRQDDSSGTTESDALAGAPLLPGTKESEPKSPTEEEAGEEAPAEESEPISDQQDSAMVDFVPIRVKRATPEQLSEPVKDELGLEDPATSKAVESIIAADADELLEAQSHRTVSRTAVIAADHIEPKPIKQKSASTSKWWRSKTFIKVMITVFLLGLAAVGAIPKARYYVLNAAGIRSAASVTVFDESTGQPLKNVEFKIGEVSSKSDSQGVAKLEKLRLGPSTLSLNKLAFAEQTQPVTVGWGSNPLGDFKLKATGSQYKFIIKDFLSKKPIDKAEVSSGEFNGLSNEKGEVVLTLAKTMQDTDKVEITVSANTYRTDKKQLELDQTTEKAIELVPARKHAYISKKTGKYDVYKVDVDGQNEEKVLAGTGNERTETMALSVHSTKNLAALVSGRESTRSTAGTSLSTLTLIDLDTNKSTTVTKSERVQLIDWIGNKLIYVKVNEGADQTSPDRHKLISYDTQSGSEHELASTNYFNDVLAANDSIYYSPAAYNNKGTVGLFKINADGNYKKTIYDKEIWSMLRTSYDKLSVSSGQEWFELNLDNDSLSPANAPAVQKSRIYIGRPNTTSSQWVDDRDGKGALLSYDSKTKEEKAVLSQRGLKNPIYWLNSHYLVYRVNSGSETADYIMNTDGGEPKKIRDVTDTAGIDRWYYY